MQRPIDHQTALIFTMVLVSAAEGEMTDAELETIGRQVRYLPVFKDFDHDRLTEVGRSCAELLRRDDGLDLACDMIAEALPQPLRETAYAVACGHFLALATFALALAVPQLLKYKGIEHWTGGVQGIVLSKPQAPFSFTLFDQPLSADRWLYFFTLFVSALMFLLAWNLLRGRVGRALIAIRDHPIAATAMGINLPIFKSLTFGTSAGFTGLAGALGGIAVAYVSPDSFTVQLSIFLLVGLIVGGLASIPGAIFGGIFIQYVPNIADELSKSAPAAIYGVLLIGLMYLMPTGVMGGLNRLWLRLRAKTAG
jgi:branched-chain amino acid transport system permease protein